jgi:type I restriction enzyme M protein
MACGGGNMLFNLEDKLYQKNEGIYIKTYGQEINDELYALAKVGGFLRGDSYINLANSLYEEQLSDSEKKESIKMDYIVCNPPHGDSWSAGSSEESGSVKRNIESAKFYKNWPSKSDSQLLFLQHAIYKLKEDGLAVIVSNGSPLFSGDAGKGESEIRKYILDNDYLEALIQLPEGEFFKTNITTYIWVINKNKAKERKNKVLLINASDMFTKMKKNKGDKRNKIDKDQRSEILDLLNGFEESKISKVFDRSYFYYNKQKLILTHVDINEKSFIQKKQGKEVKSFKVDNVKEIKDKQSGWSLNFENDMINFKNENETLKEYAKRINEKVSKISEFSLFVTLFSGEQYLYNDKEETIEMMTEGVGGSVQKLGNGFIKVKAVYKKSTKKQNEDVVLEMEIKPKTETDYEIIPYSFCNDKNEKSIQEFLDKWVDRPYERKQNVVGVEFNFNKIFYEPESLRGINEIESDLVKSYNKLKSLIEGREGLIDMSKYR